MEELVAVVVPPTLVELVTLVEFELDELTELVTLVELFESIELAACAAAMSSAEPHAHKLNAPTVRRYLIVNAPIAAPIMLTAKARASFAPYGWSSERPPQLTCHRYIASAHVRD